jgi:hypothetical protein
LIKRLPFLLLAAVAATAIVAGCGDDDETTTSTPTTTTGATGASGATGAADASPEKAAFLKEADAICAAGDKEIDAEANEVFGSGEPSAKEQSDFVENTVIPSIQEQLDQLSELDPPAEDADEFDGIVDDAQSALDELESDPSSLTSGSDPFADVNQRAQDFGLTACGS